MAAHTVGVAVTSTLWKPWKITTAMTKLLKTIAVTRKDPAIVHDPTRGRCVSCLNAATSARSQGIDLFHNALTKRPVAKRMVSLSCSCTPPQVWFVLPCVLLTGRSPKEIALFKTKKRLWCEHECNCG
jgi:hypothetical protein